MYHPIVINAQREMLEAQLGIKLREYSFAEVNEFAWRMKDISWEPGLQTVLEAQSNDIKQYVANELLLSKIDFRYWCTRYARIIDDSARLSVLIPRPSQEIFLNILESLELKAWEKFQNDKRIKDFSAKLRVILAKARQVGGTVISEAILAHLTLLSQNTRSLIASDDIKVGSVALYRKFATIYDNLPPWMRPIAESRVKATNMHFAGVNSDLIVGGGNQRNSLGQGMTIDAAHLTEMSTWLPEVADAVDEDLIPAFNSSLKHHSLLLIESTGAGGSGNWFHDLYQSASRGTSQFAAVFLGWHSCPNKFAIYDDSIILSDTTLQVAKKLQSESKLKLTKEQLNWYQITRLEYESAGKLQKFLQEYPSTADEAFQAGLVSVFPIELRSDVKTKSKTPIGVFNINWDTGRLIKTNLQEWFADKNPDKTLDKILIWELPRPGFTYVVGVDVSYGKDGRDYSAIEVVRVGNRLECDEQVAEFCGRVAPAILHKAVRTLGYMYTDKYSGLPAMVAIEVFPGPGIVIQTMLQAMGYENFYVMRKPNKIGGGFSSEFGWRTTEQTRNHLIEKGIDGIKQGYLRVNSPYTIEEMGTFIVTMTPSGRRKVEHATNAHDDSLLALFIAYYVAHESDVSSIAELRMQNWKKTLDKVSNAPRVKFQNMLGTWDTLVGNWERQREEELGW